MRFSRLSARGFGAALILLIGCRGGESPSPTEPSVAGAATAELSTGESEESMTPRLEAAQILDDRDVPGLDGRQTRGMGTETMARLLEALANRADPEKTPAMRRTQRLAQLNQMLQGESRPKTQLMLRSHLGWQLMLDGQNEAAVEMFERVHRDLASQQEKYSAGFLKNLYELSGLAHLRLAEQQNCIAHHGCQSCILPIEGDGIHQQRKAAEDARAQFARLLSIYPSDARSRWLLNITYMALGEYPEQVPAEYVIPETAFRSQYDIKRFVDVASGTGVDTIGLSGGVITDDFDNDGLLDIMASDWGIDQQLRVFRNRGNGTFAEQTLQAGLLGEVGGLNLLQADYDNDGYVDVLVLRGAWLGQHGEYPNSLLRNLGNGRFDDVTQAAGLLTLAPTQTAVWADFDLDGQLDLFVGNESSKGNRYPCQLFHNQGDGTFIDIAPQVGLDFVGFVKGVAAGDFDNDGRPDLFLSCFGEPNVLFRNLPNDTATSRRADKAKSIESARTVAAATLRFVDVSDQAGVRQPLGSFPTWTWDYDHDGWLDLLVAPFSGFNFDGTALQTVVAEYLGTPFTADRIHLYRNQGDGTFEDVAPRLGLDKPLLAMGANFGDLDNDGFLDCYFGTGDPHFGTLVPNRMFRNASSQMFQDVTTSGGFGHVQKGHGIAFADLDNDGDEDIFAVMGGAIAGDVYQNVLFENPGHGHHWITLRLRGVSSNRFGVGARIQLTLTDAAGARQIHRLVNSGGSFGASSLQQEIGLGTADRIESLRVTWPSGHVQAFANIAVDRVYEVHEDRAELTDVPSLRFRFAQPSHAGHSMDHMQN